MKHSFHKVKNLTLNFGPQHPAAHGVLRLVLYSEVGWVISLAGQLAEQPETDHSARKSWDLGLRK